MEFLLLSLVLGLAARACFVPVWDPDSFWHLAIGRGIWTTGHLLRTEIFSFSAPGRPWGDEAWLFNLGAYILWRMGGYALLEWAVALAGAISLALLYRAVRTEGAGALALACFMMVALPAFTERIRLRPDVLSLIFLALLLERIARWRTGLEAPGRSWPFVALLFALWVQCHGGWIYGLLILTLYLIGAALDARRGRPQHAVSPLSTGWAALAAAAVAVFLNPYGWKIVAFPFENFFSLFDPTLPVVFEWEHTPLTLATAPSLALFALIFLSTLFPMRKLRWADVLFAGSQLFLAFWWARYMSFAALALAPLGCRKIAPFLRPGLTRKAILAGASLLLLVRGVAIATYRSPSWSLAGNYPVQEVQFLKEHHVAGNVFHTFVAGGFLEWEYAPLGKGYMDGRLTFLPELRAYLEAKRSPDAMRAFILSHPFTLAIVPYAAPPPATGGGPPPRSVNDALFPASDWALVFFGEYGCVYLRRVPAYKPMIERYEFHVLAPYDNAYLLWSCREGRLAPQELLREIQRAEGEAPNMASALGLPQLKRALTGM